ncbi:MAG: nicotinate phosphoribosyltransferase [Candidatus Bathyarchaeia archaeon]|jgi:nicotinate phosphoribosyltransferase
MKKTELDFVDEDNVSFLTDFYELTMCASYFENQTLEPANFDLFIRRLPPNRSYFMFAGLEQILLFLKNMKFNEQQIAYLRKLGFKEDFLEYLRNFKFTGEVWAVPEGTIVFPDEPLVRVTAPIIEAQLVETFLLNTVNLETMIATKASRVVTAARCRSVTEFGLRRTQGTDAGMKAARCSYLAGCGGTSNVLAGMRYGIPVFGTMAHSYVMFFEREIDAFRAFAKAFPENSTFLIDTYDDLKGAENAAKVAKELERECHKLSGVRLDSGNLVYLSKKVRSILDENGLEYVKIFASGDLDEYKVDELLRKGAKIDSFGVGTRMSTSFDRPYVDVVYKLSGKVENGVFVPAMKLSKGKITLPGKKQVFRLKDTEGNYVQDVIGLSNEKVEGEPILAKAMENGSIVFRLPSLEEIRENALRNLSQLPSKYRKLRNAPLYPVELSFQLRKIKKALTDQLRSLEGLP